MKKTIALLSLLGASSVWAGGCANSNLSAWSNFQDNGAVNVTAESAMNSTSCGISVAVKHSQKSFVADTSPSAETRYRSRFYFDPNSIVMPSSGTDRRFKVGNAQCTAVGCPNTGVVQFKLQWTGTEYQLRGFVRDSNSNGTKNKFDVPLADGPNRIEYDLNMTAGTFKLWVDATSEGDTPVIDLSGMDMAAWPGIDEARYGQVNSPVNVTADQVVFIDEHESRRQTFIGQ